jgi:protein-S-isoprenylcysteine O-methyltransferase Ste14
MHSYLYIICPDRLKFNSEGIFQYIRHPRFLCRFITAFGIGIIANNLLAIGIVIIHFIPYIAWMRVLDEGIIRNFGNDVKFYNKKVPALFPKFKNYKKFIKILFTSYKN